MKQQLSLQTLATTKARGKIVVLTSAYRSAKNVGIHPVIVTKLGFHHIERQVSAAHLMKGAHDSVFDDRPESFNGVRVNGTVDVLTARMGDSAMLRVFPNFVISVPFVGTNQAYFVGRGLTDKLIKRCLLTLSITHATTLA